MRIALVVIGVAWAFPAVAETAALLPVEAPSLLPIVRRDLDQTLRHAITAAGLDAQPADITRAHLDSAYSAGLNCSFTEAECARRVGAVAEADVVLTASIDEVERGRFVMRVSVVRISSSEPSRFAGEIRLPGADNGASIQKLVVGALKGKVEPSALPFKLQVEPSGSVVYVDGKVTSTANQLWLMPGDHTLRIEAVGYAPVERMLRVSPDGNDNALSIALQSRAQEPLNLTLVLGVGAAAIGVSAVAVGSTIGALAERDLHDPTFADDRKTAQTIGRAGVIGAIAGGVVAAVGAGFAAMGAMQ